MQRVCNAPLKELPATLPSTHLTHANSLHTATAVPHIPRQSQTAQAGVAPTHYLFFLLTWPLFFFHLAAALRPAQVRLVRTSVCGSSAAAEARFGVSGAGTSTW